MEYIGLINVIAFLICVMLFVLGAILTVGASMRLLKLKCIEIKINKHKEVKAKKE